MVIKISPLKPVPPADMFRVYKNNDLAIFKMNIKLTFKTH